MKQKVSPHRKKGRNFEFTNDFDDWEDPNTFTSALERIEAWIFSRIIESLWWQGMISLLAAVEALSHIDGVNELKKQAVGELFIVCINTANNSITMVCGFAEYYPLISQNVGVSDAHEYLATRRAMDITRITEAEQDSIFKVVAVIHHLGNIKFDKGEESDSSILKDETSNFHLHMTIKLLMYSLWILYSSILDGYILLDILVAGIFFINVIISGSNDVDAKDMNAEYENLVPGKSRVSCSTVSLNRSILDGTPP
ncbi:hypothetical protein IFM89_012606 [Coptis chinensis]|uniref:Myosin motor domain-containing protein n=1 Tax=Coptis chinensis TaxID=261450 RepID=A0A835INF7_9MAGN|nr:hypothetical protein IFM89_012606 [Coptis chinensis]